jgi:hypothetical protein
MHDGFIDQRFSKWTQIICTIIFMQRVKNIGKQNAIVARGNLNADIIKNYLSFT